LLCQLSLEALPVAIDPGHSIVKYGEEARVDLEQSSIDGPYGKPWRLAEQRASREGAVFEIVPAVRVRHEQKPSPSPPTEVSHPVTSDPESSACNDPPAQQDRASPQHERSGDMHDEVDQG
jgi:hypothetical protein